MQDALFFNKGGRKLKKAKTHSGSPHSQLHLGAIPHLNELIQISFANEEFNGHRLTSETERGNRKVVTEMKCVAKCHATAILGARP